MRERERLRKRVNGFVCWGEGRRVVREREIAEVEKESDRGGEREIKKY